MCQRVRFTFVLPALLLVSLVACARETPGPGTPTPSPERERLVPATSTQEASSTPELGVTSQPERTATPTPHPLNDLRGTTIQFWHPWSGEREFAVLSLVNQFNAENEYGIVVTAFSHKGDLYQNVRAGIWSGVLPQVAAAYNNQLQSWDNQGGVIVDLNTFIDHPVWGLDAEARADYYPVFWDQDEVTGKRLGVAVYRTAMTLFYNQTWARELGFQAPPASTAEFRQQACAAARNDGTGGWIASLDPSTVMSWILAFGGSGLNEAGDGYDFDTPEVAAAFEYLASLFGRGCAWLPAYRYANDEFASRQGLFYTSSIAGIPYQQAAMENHQNTDQWTVLPFPSPEGDPVLNVNGPAYAILRSSPKKELAAWLFVRWITQPENQAVFIQSSGYFPSRRSTLTHLQAYALDNPQWMEALAWIPYSKFEPRLGSWGIARWAVGEAAGELAKPGFDSASIPDLLAELNALLAETHLQNE